MTYLFDLKEGLFLANLFPTLPATPLDKAPDVMLGTTAYAYS